MNLRPIPLLLAGMLLALVPPASSAAARPVQLKDFRALVRFGTPHFSPDGQEIAYLTYRGDYIQDRKDATLHVLDTANGQARVLAPSLRDVSSPRWSPDGHMLAFIAKVGTRAPQVFTVDAAGGTPVERSDAPDGVEQFSWSPDGLRIAYVSPDASPISDKDRRMHRDLFVVRHVDYLSTKPSVPSHIWLLRLDTGKARQLTRGDTSVLETVPPFGGGITAPSWSADGRWIVYTQQANADDGDSDRTRVMAVDVDSGRQHALTDKTSYEYAPRFSPRGHTVAWLYPHGPGPISAMELMVGSSIAHGARDISARLDRSLFASFAWLPDGQGLVGIADNGVHRTLYVQPLRGKGRAVDLGTLNALSVGVSPDGELAVVADGATRAPELYLLKDEHGQPRQLTHVNAGFDQYAWPRSVEVSWKAPDGQANDGILTYPNGYKAGKRYPLVVFSHGGPEAAATEGFDTGEVGPLRDLFAAHGYLVFEPNYRGSDNLGSAHEHAIYRDPGAGPDSDVISGIKMLEKQGIVDTGRIAAVGHSYGGYMTGWLISHQHFWKCAVVADGALDWTEEYELSGAGNLAWTRDSLGGSPWDKDSAKLYRSGSPITYAGQITTPTLILSGTSDITVPITESFALYHALDSRHVPVKFIALPGGRHSPHDPVHRELYYRAIEKWVGKRLGP